MGCLRISKTSVALQVFNQVAIRSSSSPYDGVTGDAEFGDAGVITRARHYTAIPANQLKSQYMPLTDRDIVVTR